MTSGYRRVVVVGASLAGLRTAEALRHHGYRGELIVIGDERHRPYDRPPLSKQLLAGTWTRRQLDLPLAAGLDAQWQLGVPATSLDVVERRVRLADGRHLRYDALVLATGARARPWPDAAQPHDGLLTLRGAEDAQALAARLATAQRLLVVGAGFLGGEVAATARTLGLRVTLVESQAQPLLSAAGPHVGRFVAELHRRAGIDLHLSAKVTEFRTRSDEGLSGALLTDGQHVPADAALVALGAQPNVEWLTGSGLTLDRGLVCDAWCRALLTDGTPAPDVVAAGDMVRWPHPLADGALLSLGHRTNATEQAQAAAHTLLHPGTAPPFTPLPSFWSDLHDVMIRSIGLPHLADDSRVIEHDDANRRLVVTYYTRGELLGAITINRTSRLTTYRTLLHERLNRGLGT